MNRITNAAIGLCLFTTMGTTAYAEIIDVRYDFPANAGVSFDWFYFGNDHGPVTGNITSTTLVIENYSVNAPFDGSDFLMTFDVPVLDSVSEQIYLTGDALGWSGTGNFSHSFTTNDFNGEIRPGRFGAQWFGGGTFIGDAYLSFTVDTAPVPAPGSASLLLGAGLIATRRRR